MTRMILIAALAALTLSAGVRAGDPQRGLEKSEVCRSCHGRDGNQVLQDTYPRLAGQHEDYLVHALKAYRSGDRQNAIMSSFAKDLSDRDIADIAAWYSSQKGLKDLHVR